MPDSPHVILPWPTVASAHAAYVRHEEARLIVPWATSAWDEYMGDLAYKKKSRYGNRYVGPLCQEKPLIAEVASLGYFRSIWSQDERLAHFLIRKWMPFATCDQCKRFRSEEKLERDPEQRREIQRQYKCHLRDIELERRCYYTNRIRAVSDPEKYLSVIIDGADQSCHLLPHFARHAHSSAQALKQKLHVYGALVHGRGARIYTFPPHVKQGHNVTIEILWRVITESKAAGVLPPVLLLQLDNTTKQNKGQYLFGFLHHWFTTVSFKKSSFRTCQWATPTRTLTRCLAGLPLPCASTTPSMRLPWGKCSEDPSRTRKSTPPSSTYLLQPTIRGGSKASKNAKMRVSQSAWSTDISGSKRTRAETLFSRRAALPSSLSITNRGRVW